MSTLDNHRIGGLCPKCSRTNLEPGGGQCPPEPRVTPEMWAQLQASADLVASISKFREERARRLGLNKESR